MENESNTIRIFNLLVFCVGGVEGHSIVLRPITTSDTEDIIRWRNSEAIRSHFLIRDEITEEMHLDWLKTRVFAGKVIQYIIVEGKNDQGIGSIYLRDIDYKNSCGELGIYIGDPNYQSNGYGSQAIRMFVEYCFSLGFHRIFLRLLKDNQAAFNCYRKCGFVQEGIAREMLLIDDEWQDIVFMSMIKA